MTHPDKSLELKVDDVRAYLDGEDLPDELELSLDQGQELIIEGKMDTYTILITLTN